MTPSTRRKLRQAEDIIYSILQHDELLRFERSKIDNALTDIIVADYHVAHMHKSHSELFADENS